MNKEIRNLLECPVCHGKLNWNVHEETYMRIVDADIKCEICSATYEIKDEIGMFLTPDLVRNDLWKQVDGVVVNFFNENKNLLSKLEAIDAQDMNGADLWYLATYYEMKQDYKKAKGLFDIAFPKVYAQEFLNAWNSNMDYIVNHIQPEEMVVDIASGKGHLVRKILEETSNKVVATDFSPTVLIRNKSYYQQLNLYNNLSLLAFDARRTPFKKDSVDLLTTNVGLSNIENPGNISKEIERISKKRFMFYLEFLKESDEIHMDLLDEYGMSDLNRRTSCLDIFEQTEFKITINHSIKIEKHPTPTGEVLDGVGIDGLPIHVIECECCVLEGRK